MRISIKAAVVSAATAALFAPVTAALADSTAIKDGTADTWTVTYDDQSNPTAVASDVTDNVDVKRTVIKFGKRVQVKQTFADLTKSGVNFMPSALLKTSKGENVYMLGLVNHDGGGWTHDGYLITGPQSGRHVSPRAVNCDTLKTSVDWAKNVFTMSAPSSCLGKNVRWIKAHAGNDGQTYDAGTDTYTDYVDNAHNGTANYRGWTDKIAKG